MSCGGNLGKFRWFYSGNQVGCFNHMGCFNFVAGGPIGSGISAGTLYKKFFPGEISRALWEYPTAQLNQKLLDASHPFIDLEWIADIEISPTVIFRVSDKNLYVQDKGGLGRFYEARVQKAPNINITLGEWLAPNFEIGDLKIEINNRDGFFNDYLPHGINYLQWIGAKISIKVGFGELLSNYHEIFRGFVSQKQGITSTNETIVLKCYDRASQDEISIPATSFDRTNYPETDKENIGKPVPIVYGDWTEEVGEYGEIPAFCSNAQDESADSYIWNISENALESIGNVYLHRGDNVADKDGPILLLDSAIFKYPEDGKIEVPSTIPTLSKGYLLLDRVRAGLGSGANTLVSDSSQTDYVKIGVQINDIIIRDNDPLQYIITSVSSGILTTSAGTFAQNDNYRILTDKYKFKAGDKISILCKGKNVSLLSVNRIADSGLIGINPRSLSVALDNTYWTIDNDAQKIYNISFENILIKTINFSDVDPSITFISSLVFQNDRSLWLLERNQSKIYRYLPDENILGLNFTTVQTEIAALLPNAAAITIDEGNILTIYDNDLGQFYRIAPYSPTKAIVAQFHRSVFAVTALDIYDLAFDVNLVHLLVIDRSTNKFFRVDPSNGSLIASSDFNLTIVSSAITFPVGVGYYIDGTIFFLNKADISIYNYNEFPESSTNIGFICRDILQSYAGKTSFDFDLLWNETSRNDLSEYKARVYINEKVNAINQVFKLLSSFNANAYIRFQKYALFQINFQNFRVDGDIIREGDIKLGTFNPSKEYNQYFNTSLAKYKELPFSETSIVSDVYASPSGIKLAGREISKTLDMSPVYLRSDLDKLVPLFLRLAAAEPEFVNLTVGFRFLFIQPSTFFNINFINIEDNKISGRRYEMIPSFVRSINVDLNTMEIKLKLWSLGTTQFGNFVPAGITGGGENDQIILTNLGTVGYVAPIGAITTSSLNSVDLELVGGINAQLRTDSIVGKAWKQGFKVDLIDGLTQEVVESKEILSVIGNTITFVNNLNNLILPTVRNSANYIIGGHYLRFSSYNLSDQTQTAQFAYFSKPIDGYPTTTSKEIEELRAGKHKFDDGRLSYVLHPFDYIPQV